MSGGDLTERERTVAGLLEKGSRVSVLHNLDCSGLLDHRHPAFAGPAIVDMMVRKPDDGLFGVFMVLDFLGAPLRSRAQIGIVVHVSQLALVPPGATLSYHERSLFDDEGNTVTIPAMDWTDDGVVVHELESTS